MRVRTSTRDLSRQDQRKARQVSASIIGPNGPIPGVTMSFSTEREDDFLACQERSGRPDLKLNRVTLVRRKVGSA